MKNFSAFVEKNRRTPIILTFAVLPINMTFSNLRRSLWRSGLRKTLYWPVNEKTWPGLWWILASTAGLFLKLYIVYLFICLKRCTVQSRWNALRLMSLRKKTEFLHVHHTFWYISWPSLLIRRKHVYGESKHSSDRTDMQIFYLIRWRKNFVNENIPYIMFEGQFLIDCRILVEVGQSVSLCFATYTSSAICHLCGAPRGIK